MPRDQNSSRRTSRVDQLNRLCAGLLAVVLLAIGGCATTTTTPVPLTTQVPAVAEADAALAARLDPILLAPGARVGVRVIELPSRRELYAREPDRPMMPASNLKLVTTATALDLFGPDHRFQTRLAVAGDDLYLIGGGDPGLGDPALATAARRKPTDDFEPFAKALRDLGTTRVRGNLYYDDRALDAQRIHPSWSKSFREFWYAAPVGGLNFNDNCIDVTVHPTTPGQPVRYEVMPPTAGIRVVNQCVTGSPPAPAAPQIRRGAGPNDYLLTGTCTATVTLASKPVEDPGHFTADAFRQYLLSQGITVDGNILPAPADGVAKPVVIATRETPLRAILNRVNKNSQNFMAEALAKLSGERFRRQNPQITGTAWQAGETAAVDFLSRHRISPGALRAVDGSGLAREDRVTARLLTDLLAVMNTHPHAAAFRDSLPIAGVDGSLKKRLADVKGRVHAKTGSIGGVRTLSGYATTPDGRTLAFSLLCNDIQGDDDDAALQRMDDALRAMLMK